MTGRSGPRAAPAIGLVDYGAGNLRSVQAAIARTGAPWRIVARPEDLRDLAAVILPGVGRFGTAAERLREAGLDRPLREFALSGRPFLGICLGMQLLFESSDEDPGVPGLAVLPGRVRRLDTARLPHIGWATVERPAGERAGLFEGLPRRFDAYFAHSFALPATAAGIVALACAPGPFAAAAGAGAAWGVQFHPEKSAEHGRRIIDNFVALARRPPDAAAAPGPARDPTESWSGTEAWSGRKPGPGTKPQSGTAPGSGTRPESGTAPDPGERPAGRMRRIIPCLDVQDGRVVKGIRFAGLRDAGDPVERAVAYDQDGADEICLLDIGASHDGRRLLLDLVERVASRLTVPLSVGGGVRGLDAMRDLLLAGADRVSIGTAACLDPGLVERAAGAFGRQFVIVSIDARRSGAGWEVTTHGGRRPAGRDAVAWARQAERLGAGEILLNAMDADGTRAGYDTLLTRTVVRAVRVPVVASGGAGTSADMARVLKDGGADAALAASIFHDGRIGIRRAKHDIARAGVRVRL